VADLARTRNLSSPEIRDMCRNWAMEYDDPDRGDLQIIPEFAGSKDEILAFLGTNDYDVDAWIAITSSDLVWKTPLHGRINRLGWAELAAATITASNDPERITIRKGDGKAEKLDLSWAAYDATKVGDLLRKLKGKCTKIS
jgi:hypothetical protein